MHDEEDDDVLAEHCPENTLEFILERYQVDELKALAGLAGIKGLIHKDTLCDALVAALRDEALVQRLIDGMDTLSRAAVAETAYALSVYFDERGFLAKYGASPLAREANTWRPHATALALFIHGGIMPADLSPVVRKCIAEPAPVGMNVTAELPAAHELYYTERDDQTKKNKRHTIQIPLTTFCSELPAHCELPAMLRLIEAGKVRVSEQTHQPAAASMPALLAALHGGDYYAVAPADKQPKRCTEPGPLRAFAWPLILQAGKLAKRTGTLLHLTPHGRAALTDPAPETLRCLWEDWLYSDMLDEFNRIKAIKGQTGRGKRDLTNTATRRSNIAAALAKCPVNQWIAFDEFSRFVRAAGFSFEVMKESWSFYISEHQYGNLGYADCHNWNVVQDRYLLVFLMEYAATMGVVDLAYTHPAGVRCNYRHMWGTDDLDCLSVYDGVQYIRVNALGAWILDCSEAYTPSHVAPEKVLRVLATLELVAMASPDAATLLFLDVIADKTADMVWKLSQTRMLDAVARGYTVASMRAFVEAKCCDCMPHTVSVFFDDCDRRAGALRDAGRARLIEARDAATALQITSHPRLHALCKLAGATWIVVPEECERQFTRELRATGHVLPGITGAA